MQPIDRVNIVAQLSSCISSISSIDAHGNLAREQICQRIVELTAHPILDVETPSPSNDADQADIALFLWLRAQGLNPLDVALEFLTPEDQLTTRQKIAGIVETLIDKQRQHAEANRNSNQAKESMRSWEVRKTDAFSGISKSKDEIHNLVKDLVQAETQEAAQ